MRNYRTQYTFRFRSDKILVPLGVSFGYGRDLTELIDRENDYMIIKKKGAQEWSGIAHTEYYPTEYWFARSRKSMEKGKERVEVLFEVQPGRKYRSVLKRLKKALAEINHENEELVIQNLEQEFKE